MRRVYFGAMVGAVVSLALAQPGSAAEKVEPLNQYIVKGTDAELDQLGALGYDVTEGADAPGRTGIVATPSQADALEAKGFDVSSLGKENTAAAPAQAAGIPLADPTWGYDVFRPWNLKPAPCQTVCSGAVDADGKPISIKQWMDNQVAANPTLVKRVVYGTSVNGQELVAYKVTKEATTTADGSKPAAMFNGAQHAREWISAEVTRREFKYVLDHKADANIASLLNSTELWFIPVFNVDGYDYTFQARATRLWRKNLRDNNNNGAIATGDGIDTNRNFSEKWRYDNEGASDSTTSDTYRGPSPESEPEVKGFHDLMKIIKPEFQIDYHSYAQLVLYPVGWQVETYGGDNPLMETLAGTDQRPAVAGYDPDVGGELYTTNGEITDTMYLQEKVMAYTVELDGGSGAGVGGTTTTGNAVGSNPGGFVFQDREADVEAVAAKNIPFMMDLAQSASHPSTPVSHLGNVIPDFVPTTFPTSYGNGSQVVEVNANRDLGAVKVNWQVNGGATQSATTSEFNGGKRYGQSGVVFHHMRGEVTGFKAGDNVKVWFTAGGKSSDAFTFAASANGRGNQVLVLSAEDYTGTSPNAAPTDGPAFLSTYTDALADAGIPADVYNFDAQNRNMADLLGVLSHYRAVVWYTGNDDYVRDPGQTTGVSKTFDDQMIAVRDYLNEGGKVLVAGQRALQGAWSQYSYNPFGRFPQYPQCSNTGNATGQLENCVQVSNDFLQYWMGANARANQATTATAVSATPIVGQSPFSGTFTLTNQAYLPRFTPISAALSPTAYPQFASAKATHLVQGTANAVGVSTTDTQLWGFGLENIADRGQRATLIREGLGALGVNPYTSTTGMPGGTVPATLSLTLGTPATFGAFVPGVGKDYTASTTANVISSAGDAALSVSPSPAFLTNGAFTLPSALDVSFSKSTWDGPVANDPVTITFKQHIGANDALRTGSYSKTLTFTLSTTTP